MLSFQNFGTDSEEHVEKQLKMQRDRWRFAITQLTKETLESQEDLDGDKEVKALPFTVLS